MFKFIEIDPNLLLASLSCELGQQNNQISLHWVKLESFSALLKITGLAPTRRYLNIFVCTNSYEKLTKSNIKSIAINLNIVFKLCIVHVHVYPNSHTNALRGLVS